jgi:hypothetical protein
VNGTQITLIFLIDPDVAGRPLRDQGNQGNQRPIYVSGRAAVRVIILQAYTIHLVNVGKISVNASTRLSRSLWVL